MWSNGANKVNGGQIGTNIAKWVKCGQTGPNRVNWGQIGLKMDELGQLGLNRV